MVVIKTDPIADLLTRIRNAAHARKDNVSMPHSKMKMAVLKVLKDRGFVADFSKIKNGDFDEIGVKLKERVRTVALTRISKPGQRIYIKSSDIKKVNGGIGVAILSTPKGVISGEEAKKLKVGGELLCEIY